MTAEVSLVSNCDDWEGIYVNGKICIQDHRLSAEDILVELNKLGIIHYKFKEISENWEGEYLPDNIQDVEVL